MYIKTPLNLSLNNFVITSVSMEETCSLFSNAFIAVSCFFFQSGYALQSLPTHFIKFGASDVDNLLIGQLGKLSLDCYE